jgi:hypothetical protein
MGNTVTTSLLSPTQRDQRLEALIGREHDYLTHLFISNEEMGEKRVSLFLTLTTGIGAAAVLAREKTAAAQGMAGFYMVFLAVTVVWFLFGYVTFIRVVRRNLVADKLKLQLCEIRKWFVSESDTAALGFLPYNPYAGKQDEQYNFHTRLQFSRGGYAELVALIDSAIAFAFGWVCCVAILRAPLVHQGQQWWAEPCAALVGAVLARLVWGFLNHTAAHIYGRTTKG